MDLIQLCGLSAQPATTAEVEDIITAPPEHDPYDRLKTELVR